MYKPTRILGSIVVWFAFLVTTPSHAQPLGEIINVNYDYYIAYADLGRDDLQAGDGVEIILSSGDRLQLVVKEASLVVSQLVLPSNADQQARNLFRRIAISDKVRVTSTDASSGGAPSGKSTPSVSEPVANPALTQRIPPENVAQPAVPNAVQVKLTAEQENLIRDLRLQQEHYIKQVAYLEEQRRKDAATLETYKKEVDRLNDIMNTLAAKLERMAQISSQSVGKK